MAKRARRRSGEAKAAIIARQIRKEKLRNARRSDPDGITADGEGGGVAGGYAGVPTVFLQHTRVNSGDLAMSRKTLRFAEKSA
jgi:hypothetical protein